MPKTYDPSWHHLAVITGPKTYEPPSLADLKATAEGENIPALHNTFETGKVILTTLGPLPNAFPRLLVEMASDPRFTLYRVERPDPSESRRAWRSNSLFLPLD